MKHQQHTTPELSEPSLRTIGGWYLRLLHLHQRLSPRFARPEVRQHVLLYLQAILSDIPRKNGWQIAEHARLLRPYPIQRLLSHAVWDHDGVRDDLRSFVYQTLSPAPCDPVFPVLVIDESGFPKRGRHSAGVAPQYCGRTGRIENCQVGVFLSYVTEQGHALIDRELYLPEDWCADLLRRHSVHIPDAVSFHTKPELALHMLKRAQQAALPIRWVVADTVYGHSTGLRLWLQEQGYAFALAVPSIEVVCVQTKAGLVINDVASLARQWLHARDWHRLSASLGTKGERLFDWASLPLAQGGVSDGRNFLVIRRCLDEPHELAYYLVCAPLHTPLCTIVQVIGARWHIEEDLQACKALGLDQYEVRSSHGWYRHITLVLLAAAFLLNICIHDRLSLAAQDPPLSPCPALIVLTSCEVRHLLAHLLWPASTAASFLSRWSLFRRSHQYWAGYYHRRRREKQSAASLTGRSSLSKRPALPSQNLS